MASSHCAFIPSILLDGIQYYGHYFLVAKWLPGVFLATVWVWPWCCHSRAESLLLYVNFWASVQRKNREKVKFWVDSLHLSERKVHLFLLCVILFEKGCLNDIACFLLYQHEKLQTREKQVSEQFQGFST